MCSICRPTWKNVPMTHTETNCPIRNSRYCSYCASYGHLTKACPAPPPSRFTQPLYVEQLIPPSELKQYRITTLTPLPQIREDPPQQILEIQDNERAIAAFLAAHSVKPMKGCTKRHILEEYAKQINKRVVYLP